MLNSYGSVQQDYFGPASQPLFMALVWQSYMEINLKQNALLLPLVSVDLHYRALTESYNLFMSAIKTKNIPTLIQLTEIPEQRLNFTYLVQPRVD